MRLIIKKLLILLTIFNFSQSSNEINIDFSKTDLKDYVSIVSNYSDLRILSNENLNFKISYFSNGKLSEKDLMPLLKKILRNKNLYLSKEGKKSYQILKIKEAQKLPIKFFNNVKDLNNSKLDSNDLVTIKFDINLKNKDYKSRIASVLSYQGNIQVLNNGQVLITDYFSNITDIINLTKELEKKDSFSVKTIFFDNVSVKDIDKSIKHIFKEKGTAIDSSINLEVNVNSNSLILSGNSLTVNKLYKILSLLDISGSSNITKIIPVKYAKAKDVLNNLQNSVPLKGIKLSENEQMNAIILTGLEFNVKKISKLIEKLDFSPKQIYISSNIIELSDDNSEAFGIKYGLNSWNLGENGLLSLASDLGASSYSLPTTILDNLTIPSIEQGIMLGASVDLLEEEGVANIISKPSLLCLNNQSSSIYVGNTESIITGAEDDPDSTSVRNSYSREDIGLKMKLLPRVIGDDKISIQVEIVLEDILPGSELGMPKTTKREIITEIIALNGETIILGGLIKDKTTNNDSSVPVLSDIPILGKAFQHQDFHKDKVNLLIIISPYIIDNNFNDIKKQLMLFERSQKKVVQDYINKHSNKHSNNKLNIEEKQKIKINHEENNFNNNSSFFNIGI